MFGQNCQPSQFPSYNSVAVKEQLSGKACWKKSFQIILPSDVDQRNVKLFLFSREKAATEQTRYPNNNPKSYSALLLTASAKGGRQ